jgi:hypothetical protein
MRAFVWLVTGWVAGIASLGAVWASSGYDHRMLSPAECVRFKVGQFDIGDWTIATSQPNECYLQRSRFPRF